ncbi:DUF296 domain-containing protein [Vibrio vulnificus]|nr:DUF296 domain-containing protein [Vibrio vulnificus]ELV8611656.1 DUF296 domain-containing protein [Vibrio vulnificus]MCU8134404.1 DUF296 domain-containing protein [Vibrio vulnificus]
MSINVIAKRLEYGADLKREIANIVIEHNITAGSIAACTGCLSEVKLRLAGAQSEFQQQACFEIVAITATLTPEHQHVHLAIADEHGRVYGGHLLEGCLVDTTVELIVHAYSALYFERAWDEKTGYTELVIKQ